MDCFKTKQGERIKNLKLLCDSTCIHFKHLAEWDSSMALCGKYSWVKVDIQCEHKEVEDD